MFVVICVASAQYGVNGTRGMTKGNQMPPLETMEKLMQMGMKFSQAAAFMLDVQNAHTCELSETIKGTNTVVFMWFSEADGYNWDVEVTD